MNRSLGYLLSGLAISLFLLVCISRDASAAQAQVAWNPDVSQVAGYKVYYGLSTGNYTTTVDVGNNTISTLQNLSSPNYYIAVTAYDSSGNQSGFSPELAIDLMTASAGAGGTIEPSGSFFQSQGSSQTFTITPSAGYQIADVQVDNKSVGPVGSYTLNGISASHSIAATFSANATSYTITTTAGSHGSISPSGTVAVSSGASQSFTITPNTGYQVAGVEVDGSSVGAVSSYTITNVTANHTISAIFSPIATHTISAIVQGGGSISPSGNVNVVAATSEAFTITPVANHEISGVRVDGKSIGAVSSYTFTNVAANHTIEAAFAPIRYRIWSSTGGGGSISPSGTLSVSPGANEAFTITPAAYYQLEDVVIDGVSVGTVSSEGLNRVVSGGKFTRAVSYAFTNVTTDHRIQAVFTKIPPPVADAGPDQAVESSSIVSLNGSNSTDTVSGIASYKWTQVSGPRVKLSNPSASTCTFTAPNVTSGKMLEFNLAVINSAGIKGTASCLVNVSGTDQAPSANAGTDRIVSPYTNVTLDGSGSSDPNGTIASYRWVQINGPRVEISDANSSIASFVAPDPGTLGASLVFQLQVTDHFGLTTRDQCIVNVVTMDQPPVANAGPDLTVAAMSPVTLDGSGSYDPVNSTDSYRWKQISGTPVTLSDPTAMTPIFTAPAVSDSQNVDLVFMLTVTDVTDQLSDTAKCTVTVTPN
ncbi:MAG: hypothetical protein WAN11_09110 [Syntrophobacteraceae bacterium]